MYFTGQKLKGELPGKDMYLHGRGWPITDQNTLWKCTGAESDVPGESQRIKLAFKYRVWYLKVIEKHSKASKWLALLQECYSPSSKIYRMNQNLKQSLTSKETESIALTIPDEQLDRDDQ